MADDFGALSPCQSTLTFSIARNTELRALAGTIRILDSDRQAVGKTPLLVSVSGPEGGMFRGEQAVPPVPEASCRSLEFKLEIERCRGENDKAIECPEMRIRPSDVLRRLEASSPSASVCYGD